MDTLFDCVWLKLIFNQSLNFDLFVLSLVFTLAAIKSGTQAELAQLVSRNPGSATLLPLQAPPLDSR